MADNHIDQDELQTYGMQAAAQIRALVMGQIKELDAACAFIAERLAQSTAAVRAVVGEARLTDAQIRKGARDKNPAFASAVKMLGRFSKHLDAHDEGAIDRRLFFPGKGTVRGVVKGGAAMMVHSLRHIATELKKKDSPVADAAGWRARMVAASDALAPAVERTQAARSRRRHTTPEVVRARAAWMDDYGAAKDIVGAVLRLAKKPALMTTVFADLGLRARAKRAAPGGVAVAIGEIGAEPQAKAA